MTEKNYKVSYTVWQEAGEDAVAEEALLIECYNDVVAIQNESRTSKRY
jgi:hypothetical protein